MERTPVDHSFAQYFKEIAQTKMLSHEEMLVLARTRVQMEREAWAVLLGHKTVSKRAKQLHTEDPNGDALRERAINNKQALEKIKKADDVVCKMMAHNLRLVISVAKRHRVPPFLSLGDLIQEGNLGLFRAARRFDPEVGVKFSTYAVWWIRHTIGRALQNDRCEVRVPVHAQESASKIDKARIRFWLKEGRKPTTKELAKKSGVDNVEEIELLLPNFIYLNGPAGGTDINELQEVFESPNGHDEKNAFDLASISEEYNHVREAMEKLRPMDRLVLMKRFGISCDEMNLQEIGDEQQLSRERIRQIQERALAALRVIMNCREKPEEVESGRVHRVLYR